MIGSKLTHYEIAERLGAGGMGVVYRAKDVTLGREVALKILAPHLANSATAKSRLSREARAISALNHPNIATLYEAVETGDETVLVLEYLPGGTLASRLSTVKSSGRELGVEDALAIAIDIAEGLAHAHRHGIVHRDLKPSNLMFDGEGRVKITDFGLSKLAGGAELTRTDAVLGTIAYMSPEQRSGEEADHRSDIYSFGLVLREMAGRSSAMDGIIARATQFNPADRYQRAEDLAADLRAIRTKTANPTQSLSIDRSEPRQSRRTLIRMIAVCMLLAVVAVLIARRFTSRGRQDTSVRVIAVLPFENVGRDSANEAFCDGMVETLTSALTELQQFHGSVVVVPASEVRSQNVDSPSAARRAFGAKYVITGSVQRSSAGVRLTANLVDTARLAQVAARSIKSPLKDANDLQDKVVTEVAGILDMELQPQARALLAAGQTRVPGTYQLYVEARGYLDRYDKPGNLEKATKLLEAAVARDPKYALAYAALGEAKWVEYRNNRDPQLLEAAQNLALRAIEIDNRIPAAYTGLGLTYAATGRYPEAINEYKRALNINPVSVEAYRELGAAYEAIGNVKEAEQVYKRAVQLRPSDWFTYLMLGTFYFKQWRYGDAEPVFRKDVDLTPDNFLAFANLGSVHVALGKYAAGESDFRRSIELRPTSRGYTGLATAYFYQGRYREAVAWNEKAAALAAKSYTVFGNLADSYRWAPGFAAKAPEMYRRAIENVTSALAQNPKNADALSRRAVFWAKLSNRREAALDIEAARLLAPRNARILFHGAIISELAHDRAPALRAIRDALQAGYPLIEIEREPELSDLRRDTQYRTIVASSQTKPAM